MRPLLSALALLGMLALGCSKPERPKASFKARACAITQGVGGLSPAAALKAYEGLGNPTAAEDQAISAGVRRAIDAYSRADQPAIADALARLAIACVPAQTP